MSPVTSATIFSVAATVVLWSFFRVRKASQDLKFTEMSASSRIERAVEDRDVWCKEYCISQREKREVRKQAAFWKTAYFALKNKRVDITKLP